MVVARFFSSSSIVVVVVVVRLVGWLQVADDVYGKNQCESLEKRSAAAACRD